MLNVWAEKILFVATFTFQQIIHARSMNVEADSAFWLKSSYGHNRIVNKHKVVSQQF